MKYCYKPYKGFGFIFGILVLVIGIGLLILANVITEDD